MAFAEQRRADSTATVLAKARREQQRLVAKRLEQARRDSLALVRRQQRRADSLAWVARKSQKPRPAAKAVPARAAAPPTAPAAPTAPATPAAVSAEVWVSSTPQDSLPGAPRVAVPGSDPRVKLIEPFTAPTTAAALDTCACRVRGTVEVSWPRPLEEGLVVEVVLEGPALQRTEVTLDMGAPREFRLGPLPCGAYRLRLLSHGRLRYALARGGDELRVNCAGLTQVRVMLTPLKK